MISYQAMKEKIKQEKNELIKKIMYRLINIYESECKCNEGELGYRDIYEIYALLKELEK